MKKDEEIEIKAQCDPMTVSFLSIIVKAIVGGIFYGVTNFFTKMFLTKWWGKEKKD